MLTAETIPLEKVSVACVADIPQTIPDFVIHIAPAANKHNVVINCRS